MRKKRKPVRSKSKGYMQYTEGALQNAYASVRENKLTIYQAAKSFHVPYMTLYDRIKGKISMDRTIGRKTLLSNEQESALASYFKFLFSIGYGYSKSDFLQIVTDQLVHCRTKDNTESCKVGKMWYYNFLKRNPDVISVRPHQKPGCASRDIVSCYYDQLSRFLKQHGLFDKPHATYCMDKVALAYEEMQAHPGGDSSDDIETKSPEGNRIIVIAAGNASGRQLPPFFVFPGESKLPRITDVSPGASGSVSSATWADSNSLKKYLFEHFLPLARSSEPDDSLVLLYDGQKFPLFPGLIEWAQDKKLFLFPLPPHVAFQKNGLSLLDNFDNVYTQEFQNMVRRKKLPKIVISKNTACQVSCDAYTKIMLPEVLISYFLKCGIIPFSRFALPEHAYRPLKTPIANANKLVSVTENTTDDALSESDESSSDEDEKSTYQDAPRDVHRTVKRKANFLSSMDSSNDEFSEAKPRRKSRRSTKPSRYSSSANSSSDNEAEDTAPEELNEAEDTASEELNEAEDTASEELLDAASVVDAGLTIEDGEQRCCVCMRVEPPGVGAGDAIVIVEWIQCDACCHWTHLQLCTKAGVINRDEEFRCIHCVPLQVADT